MPWAPAYATNAELKSLLRIPALDTEDDAELGLAIESASRAVDDATNRQFGKVAAAEARVYTAKYDRWRSRWSITIDDLMDDTGLVINVDDDDDQIYDQAVDAFRLYPFNAAERGRPWTRILVKSASTTLPTAAEGTVQVSALWGWTAVPETIKEATLLQASRFFQRRNAPFGVAGSPEMGSELRLLQKVDVDVGVMVRPFIRWWGAV